MNGHTEEDVGASLEHVFDQFVTAVTCKSILASFHQLLDLTGLRHADHSHFYEKLKAKLKGSWKAQSLWAKLDKRAAHREYKKGQACKNMRVLVIGAGPCGMRTAIECALLGARTVVVEKRDRFSRNNVLHLWPYLITDLRNLGAKKFFGKFCAGAIDHISIRQLQCILLKVALLLGVEVHCNVAFEGLIEPPEDQSSGVGWRCKVSPENHALSEFELDVLIGADGKRNTLPGFKRKEFRGKLAIAVTANFINRNTQAEARVEEISGVAFIFNQKFFLDLKESTRIDLENIVYYKDDTHYFVMTAKKASLLEKGVLKEDHSDTITLLDRENVNQDALMAYAREAADFSTNYQLPSLDYAVNHYGQADVAMFDFTSMFAAENASRFMYKNGHHLLMGLVGDSLLEPFWPTGSGCARGFLGAFDAAWMIRSWAMGKTPLQVLSERESIFTVLSQTTPNYLHKNHNSYTIDPNSRYPNLNLRCVKPGQVRHLYEGGQVDEKEIEEEEIVAAIPSKKPRNAELTIDSYSLLRWCQRVLNTGKYRDVHVVDFTSSWRSGLALCALIHSFRPELINNTLLMECEVAVNNQLAFNVAEQELGIPPVMSGEDMAKHEVPDKLTMVAYLTQFYELFKHEPLPSSMPLPVKSKRKSTSRDAKQQPKSPRSPNRRISFLQKLSSRLAKSKKRKEQEENEGAALGSKKLKEREEIISKTDVELTRYSKLPMEEIANKLQLDRKPEDTKVKVNKTEEMSGAVSVTAMADLLVAKFKSYETQPVPEPVRRLKGQPALLAASSASEFCSFCHKRVYIMERMSAEGEFFHRQCLKCDHCGVGLRLTNYSCDRDTKPVKFYCYRHALPELRLRPQRKRGLEDELKENVPDMVVTPAPDVIDTGQASNQKSPRKAAPSHLSPLLLPPKDMSDKPKKTPERVEFEISFDGAEEESEEEQFEFNLRASLSSDTLLDDEDDSDLSDSDIESGAEDEVWENAVESLKSSGTPLTLEEAFELRGSWRRQHSQENLMDAVEQERLMGEGPEYTRLRVNDGEEDGSSTEVEEESEYETDDSSEEEDSDEDRTEPTKSASTDDRTETSLRSPVSPVSKLSASKASFFSEPPKVVSLDPWSMFGMGKDAADKESEKKISQEDGVKVKRKKSSASDRKKSSSSESKSRSERKKSTDSKKDVSSKDTDISESLELDSKSQDVFLENGERVSEAGSLEEIKEDLGSDVAAEVPERVRNKSVDSQESLDEREKKPQSILKRGSVDKVEVGDLVIAGERDRGSEGDDEGVEGDDDDMLEKTAVSKAMEQLLLDIDHRSFSKDSSASENFLNDTSDSADNEMYVEGRLSPSANKTRKFRMKRHARRSKERRVSRSTTSDSEAGRTDPTTTDNSQPRSSISRSPSAELGDGDSMEVSTPISEQTKSVEEKTMVMSNLENIEEPVQSDQLSGDLKETEEDGTSVSDLTKQEQLVATDIGTIKLETVTGDESLAHALAKAAAMSDLSDNSDLDDLVLKNVDDRFVTDRRRPSQAKKRSKLNKLKRKQLAEKTKSIPQEESQVNSSFSISTPSSGSEDSVSSIEIDEFAGEILDVDADDDAKPDQDMMRDYTTTMSIALGESYSDGEEEGEVTKEKENNDDTVTESDKKTDDTPPSSQTELEDKILLSDNVKEEEADVINDTLTDNASSLYVTPETSMEKGDNDTAISPTSAPTRRPLPKPRSQVPVPQPRKSVPLPSKDQTSHSSKETTPVDSPISPTTLTPPKRNENRDSSENELFLSPMENFVESPLVNKSSTHPAAPTSPAKSSSVSKPIVSDSILTDKSSKTKSTPSSTASSAPASATTKSQRKLPQLPKLNVPSRQPLRPNAATKAVEQPIMCSSPKVSNKIPPSSTSHQEFKRPVRPLPVPDSTNQSLVNKSSTTTPSSMNKSSNQTSNHKFTTPVSPPVFKAPAKTKVPLDKSKLRLGSSTDRMESDTETERKKISANGIVIDNSPDGDIPFADESEAEEKFYTPCAPDKKAKPKFNAPSTDSVDARKRILSSPEPAHKLELTVLSADQIRGIQIADIEKAKHQARERARLMSDEELGLDSLPNSPSRLLSKPTIGTPDKHANARRSASYDTPSTSDVLSDSDDKLSSVQTATSSATEGDQLSQPALNSNKKKKVKTPKNKKEKKGNREKKSESDKKEKKKSLFSLIIPNKNSDKGVRDSSNVLSSDNTPRGSDDNSKHKKNKTPKVKKSNDKKSRFSKSNEDLDKTPTSENVTDLAICSVFHSEASNRQARNELGVGGPVKKTIPVAPRASVDELSDSDESHISFSTMQRRRDEDLDERVARRMKKIQLKQQKQAEHKRLHMAQEIQRQLEEVEVRQKELEERGIAVEKALRGDGPEGENVDEGQLMNEWFTLVHEKNALLRYESELNVRAKELELEDRQARLETDFRERSKKPAKADHQNVTDSLKTKKTDGDIAAEGNLLDELLEVVEQRNTLVAMLEEDRLREQKEDKDLKDMMLQKGYVLSPLSYDTRRERQKLEAPLAPLAL